MNAKPAQFGIPDSLSQNAVTCQNVEKTYVSGKSRVTALKDVSLNVALGSLVSLIGPSGCGKSTLLSLIGDLGGSYSGQIWVGSKSPASARLDREYGIVFQDPALLEWRRVRDNILLPLQIMKLSEVGGIDREQAVDDMIEMVGLTEFRSSFPWQLSGGMQQRVAIARALVFRPRLLLMDEPFGALDELTRDRMDVELLRIYEETETTIVFVTHSIAEAVFLSTHVVVMTSRPGRIQEVITVDLPYPRESEVRQTTRFFELVNQVRRALACGSSTDG